MGWLSRHHEVPMPIACRDIPRGLRLVSTYHPMTIEWDVLADGNGKYLRIDRIPYSSPLDAAQVAELVDFCGEPCTSSSQLRKAPTISHDIALKTITFLKETN